MSVSRTLFSMFGPSPISPLQKHMAKVTECAKTLQPFFDAIIAENWAEVETYQAKIAELENQADELKTELRLNLPKGLFLPIHRYDILELLIVQDRIANKTRDIAGLMLGRKMTIPAVLTETLTALLTRSIDACEQAQAAIDELDELLETGFGRHSIKIVKKMIVKLDKIEHETDNLQIQVRQQLLEMEKELPPVDVIFLYKIIEWLGELADRAETVGGQMQLLLAR